jgi:16S rRNA (guanine1516-N2)-methyltransferase
MLVKNTPRTKPLFIDFLSPAAEYRRLHSGRKQLIAKAVGIKSNKTLTVLDTTAGFGQDAVILAQLGCEVTMLERSPIIYALLQDALIRAKNNPEFAKLKLSLINCDAISYLKTIVTAPDVIYLDPMYPHRTKSALNKNTMRILRKIVGDDLDAAELLQAAKKIAGKRVVVKRPRLAPAISNLKPDVVYIGKSSRFDVYL